MKKNRVLEAGSLWAGRESERSIQNEKTKSFSTSPGSGLAQSEGGHVLVIWMGME